MELVDWSGRLRLQRNQRAKRARENHSCLYQPKAPQEEPSRRTAFATEKRSVWEHGCSDEEVGKIELHLSALGDARGKRPYGTEISGQYKIRVPE